MIFHSSPPLAYIGPGAGFTVLGSFLSLALGLLAGAVSFLFWPLRVALRWMFRRGFPKNAKARKVIFLGLDGLDPRLTERLMDEGRLPNFARLRDQGSYRRLRTTYPALSPVAWSTFATGVSPGRHNMFDFLNRNLRTYLPELASTKIHEPRRVLRIGSYRIPVGKPVIEMRRKSKTFWKVLGERNIPCTILRVPISFPPEEFEGKLLSAMCTPDLLGTQGSFTQFTTREAGLRIEGGRRVALTRKGRTLSGAIEGPADSTRDRSTALSLPFELTIDANCETVRCRIQRQVLCLRPGQYSPWIRLNFRTAIGGKISGMCRFMITEVAPHVSLYVTPINLDPERPALPISCPAHYASYLAKLLGPYATLGMAEDTWALNESVIDENAFLVQAYEIFAERERMFFNALEKTTRGIVACVFDTTDRVQHMFWRDYTNGKANVIEQLYIRMDQLLLKTLEEVKPDTVLFVLSDHGFASFHTGVNLNTWLRENGYLTLNEGVPQAGEGLRGVDWSRTQAYTVGLAGIYINIQGRESQGIVARGKMCAELKRELIGKLSGLRQPDRESAAINSAVAAETIYSGPYLDSGPDILIGFNDGYRTSWTAALGRTSEQVFEPNDRAWSGDHCIDPALVPGVLFCNRKMKRINPGIEDLAPTAVDLFGIAPPAYMEGTPVL